MERYNSDIYRSKDGRHLLHNLYRKHLMALPVPIREQMIETEYGDTHVVFYGNPVGKPVLVFYGELMLNPLSVLPFVTQLDLNRIQLVVPDPPGTAGFSSGRKLLTEKNEFGKWGCQLIDALDVPCMAVLGYSMGGRMALDLAVTSLLRVERLLLVLPSGILSTSALKIAKLIPAAAKKSKIPSSDEVRAVLNPILNFDYADLSEAARVLLAYTRLEVKNISKFRKRELESLHTPVFLVAEKGDYLFPGEAVLDRARKTLPQLVGSQLLSMGSHSGFFKANPAPDVLESFQAMTNFILSPKL